MEKGILFKLNKSKKFSLIPKVEILKFNFFANSLIKNKKYKFVIPVEKNISWLWFNINISLERLGRELVDDTPANEVGFKMIPPSFSIVEESYDLKIEKKENYIEMKYINSKDGSLLENTLVHGDSLENTIYLMIFRLKETDNIKFFKHTYKKMFEDFFKIQIAHEKKFDPYYE
jgi:hypothetical protein